MINGLNFDIDTKELEEILNTKIQQFSAKASLYQEQAEQQEELTRRQASIDDSDLPKFSNDQSTNLRSKANEQLQKVKEFTFLRDHLIKNETYRLTRDDLNYLGIVHRRF